MSPSENDGQGIMGLSNSTCVLCISQSEHSAFHKGSQEDFINYIRVKGD